jgi:hypothetical protein
MAGEEILFELSVCQLAAWIPFEGVVQHESVKNTLTLMKFAAAKLRICAKQVIHFYIKSHIF